MNLETLSRMRFSLKIRRLVGPLILCSLLLFSLFSALAPQKAYAAGVYVVLTPDTIHGRGDIFDTGASDEIVNFKKQADGRWLGAVITQGNAYSFTLTNFVKKSQGNNTYSALQTISGEGNNNIKQTTITISDSANVLGGNPPGGGTGSGDEEEEEETSDGCPIEEGQDFRWAMCPIYHMMSWATNTLDAFINHYLSVGNSIYTNEGGAEDSYKKAWSTIRNFAIALLMIAGLVMLISEALGWSVIDAYTVRKALPRLLIAIIGISVSWELCKFLIGFFDSLGQAAGGVIYSAFDVPRDGSIIATITTQVLATGGAGVAALLLGPLGLLSMLGTLLLAMLIATVVLILRQAIIVACVIMAPLAIAAYILPNTSKLANFWWDTLTRMLMLYPIATGLIALCKSLGIITFKISETAPPIDKLLATVSGTIFFFAGYALIPLAFRLAGGLVATIGGIANDRSRGGFDRLKKARQGQVASRWNSAREDRGDFMGATPLGKFARRTTLGGNPLTRRGRDKYNANRLKALRNTSDAALKDDNNFASGNDDGNLLAAQEGMTRGRFLTDYANMMRSRGATESEAQQQARQAMAELESGYGAQIGSNAMRLTAFKALNASNKGIDTGDFLENARLNYGMAASLVNSGVLNVSDAAAITKSNQARPDQAGVGFGSAMGAISRAADRHSRGMRGADLVTEAEGEGLAREVLSGTNPGAIIQGRWESVDALAPQMATNIRTAALRARQTGDMRPLMQTLAATGGLYDELARTSPQKAKIMADQVMSAGLTDSFFGKEGSGEGKGDMVTVRELMERAREWKPEPGSAAESAGSQSFLEMRREYGSRARADAANHARAEEEN